MTNRRLHQLVIVSCFLFVLGGIWLSFPETVANGQADSDPAVEMDVIARLNAWRMSEKIAPLKLNADLQKLALKQAEYLVSLPTLPLGGEMHRDSYGQLPPERAFAANWPAYGMKTRVAVGENAAVGDAKFALRYWLNSEIHKNTALNPAYREIGVAAVKFHKDFMIIAVFGARPNYLPVFIYPEEGTLYFTNEQYHWKAGGKWVQDVGQIRIVDSTGKPLIQAPLKFTSKVPLPPLTTDEFKVILQDGALESDYTVNVKTDVVIIPRLKPAGVALVASAVKAVFGPPPTNTPRSIVAAPSTNGSTVGSVPSGTAEPTKAATTLKVDRVSEILILYDDKSLVIVNDTNKPANISDLKLRYQGHILASQRWPQIEPPALLAFPANHCMMLEVVTAQAFWPETCSTLRSVIYIPTDRLFWQQGPFDVLRGDQVLATCNKQEGNDVAHCEIPWK